MPLLRRREFKPLKPPPDLRLNEEVFVCRLTNELFRDYNEFFKRTILCNSLVWSCSLTGKPSLTYQEAVESEAKARRYLASFPVYLVTPVLYLVTLTQRGRLADLCDDVFIFVRDRYFIGEIVDVSHQGMRETCRVVRVIPPMGGGVDMTNGDGSDSDVILIDEDGQEKVMKMGEPKCSRSKKTLPATDYRYQVMSLQGNGTYEVDYKNIGRKKGLFTREKNKLFLKQHCAIVSHIWCVKREYKTKFNLQSKTFHDFFAGPSPLFVFSPGKRTWKCSTEMDSSGEDDEDDDLPLCEFKKKAQAKQQKDAPKSANRNGAEKENKSKQRSPPSEPKKPKMTLEEREAVREKIRQEKMLMKEQQLIERAQAREMLRMQRLEEKEARKEQMRKIMEEDRLKKMKEREAVREALREEKRLQDEHLREFNRIRDDLECDDLMELPWPKPVNIRVPRELFGDVVMLLEFMYHFKEYLGFSEEFPDGISLEQLDEALLSKKVDGLFYDLVHNLLTAIFRMQEEEEEDEKVDLMEQGHPAPSADLAETLCDDDPTYAAMTKAATSALIWPQIHQGTLLRQLPIDSTTISEVLRLHFLSSGARTTSENTKWRYQQRGGFIPHDDPGMEFRMQDPEILRTLTTGNMFDLLLSSKMKILTSLCGQLLTYVTMRDIIEESLDTFQTSRKEWRELVRLGQRREREDATAKWKRKLEERALEREHEHVKRVQRERERTAQLRQDEQQLEDTINVDSGSEAEGTGEGAADPPKQAPPKEAKPVASEAAVVENLKPLLTPEELETRQRQEEEENAALKAELVKRDREYRLEMAQAAARYSIAPLGEDRIYRRFWLFSSLPGLFVEHDDSYFGEMDLSPVPQVLGGEPATEASAERVTLPELQTASDDGKETSAANGDGEIADAVDEPKESDSLEAPQLIKEPVLVNGSSSGNDQPLEPDPCMLAQEHAQWAYYSTPQQLGDLLLALNNRGFRERALKEALLHEKMRIEESLKTVRVDSLNTAGEAADRSLSEDKDVKPAVSRQVTIKMNSGKKGLLSDRANGEESLELLLREQILDIEERVWNGSLGIIKIDHRAKWIEAIEQGAFDRQCQQISWGPLYARSILDDKDFLNMSMCDLPQLDDDGGTSMGKKQGRLAELRRTDATGSPSSTRCSTPSPSENVVRDLACALLQVSQGIDAKYLKAPLGAEDTSRYAAIRKSKRMQEKLEGKDDSGDEEEVDKKPRKTCRECWEESLMAATSLPQIFLHLSTLERSIIWAKSILNARCRFCRRKGDAEQMLLCDGCDRGLHMYCLKPPLKKVPQGEWYCKDCKPKEMHRSPRKKRRNMPTKQEEELMEDEDDADDDEEEEDASSEEEEEEEEEVSSEEEAEEASSSEELEDDVEEEDSSDAEEDRTSEDDDDDDSSDDMEYEVPHKMKEEKDLEMDYDDEDDAVSGDAHEDTCHKCSHGGELVCCDKCPRAFHTECCSPVLTRIPKGRWGCEVCRKKPSGKGAKAQQAAGKSKETTPKSSASSRYSTGSSKGSTGKKSGKTGSSNRKNQSAKTADAPGGSGGGGRRQMSPSETDLTKMMKMTRGVKVVLTALNGKSSKRRSRSQSLDDSASEDSGPSLTYHRRLSSTGRGSEEMKQLHQCEEILKEMVKHPDSQPFLSAVSKKNVPDYYKIIKRPMDFASMQSKVNAVAYHNATEFIADVQLIFTNCQQYNQPWSSTYKSGNRLRAFFERRLKALGVNVPKVRGDRATRGAPAAASAKAQPPKKKQKR